METLLRIGLSNAVVALLMALMVVTVACVWRRPAVLHALWLLILIKLVTPPFIWVRVPWPMVAVAATPQLASMESLQEEDTVFVPDSKTMRETPIVETSAEPMASGGRRAAPDPATDPRLDDESGVALRPPLAKEIETFPIPGWTTATCAVWLVGAVGWYALALVRLRRFRRLLRHALPAPESLRQRTQRLADKLRLRRCPSVWLVPGRVAPMLWAAGGRPRILFPADLLKQVGVEQQNALLVHELAHLRRRDHWVRWLEFITAGLYWWNPVLWFARRELREAEEQCCDAWVTSTLPGAGKTYATALLETLDFLSDAPPAMPLLASGVGRVVDLKRRLTMIMRGTTPRALGWRGAAAVVGLGALLLPMLPAWVQAQAPAKAEAKEVQLSGDVKVFKFADATASPADLEKARAELKMLEAVLEQRKAEVAEATARVEAARARVSRDETATKAADGDDARLKELGRVNELRAKLLDARREASARAGEDASNYDIIVKVNGDAEYKALQDFLKQIEAVKVQGASPTLIVLDRYSGKVLLKWQPAPPPSGARWVGPGDPGYHPGQPPLAIAASDTDKRIIELEMKLKSILNEVEQLRQERRPAAPKPSDSESKPHSYGPAPLEKLSVVGQLFKAVDSATPQDAAAKMLREVEAGFAAEKEHSAALAAERDASQAKIKMLEDEIAKLKRWEIEANSSRAKPYPTKP